MTYLFGESDPELLKDETLVDIFEATVRRLPLRPAVHLQDRAIAYQELSRLVDMLCWQLAQRRITRGACVAILMHRGIEAYAALLAVMKVGAAYIPIEPSYPVKRIAFIVEDCQAQAIMTTKSLLPVAEKVGSDVFLVDFSQTVAPKSEPPGIPSLALPDDDAYIIYTSGTTGKPKGVPISHRNVCHFVRAEGKLFGVTPNDRVYQGFSLSFDASIEEFWLAWFAGAVLVIAPEDIAHSGEDLAPWLAQQSVTVLSCVPTLLALFEHPIPSLNLLILGGEACPPHLVARWAQPGLRMVNSYGPTEATVVATYAFCQPDRSVTIGRPLPNCIACIVDENLRPVADGEPGELCLGGPGLSRGYLNREELTKTKFIDWSENGVPGAPSRLYRTGDRVRLNPDNEIDFLGRVDDQVKLRGFRIELGDVEAALRALPGVRHAAATVREDIPGVQQLVGYLVPSNTEKTAPFDETSFRNTLRKQLPGFMVPALLETIDTIPTLASGKIDRKSLPAPKAIKAPVLAEAGAEARSEMEKYVMATWSAFFPDQSVGRMDNFFDLGGHSLLAARMVSDFRRLEGLGELSVVDVYRNPVLADFAARLDERLQKDTAVETPVTHKPADSSPHMVVGPFGRWACWLGQLVGLYLIFAVSSLQWFVPWFVFDYFEDVPHRAMFALLVGLAAVFALQPVQMLLCVAIKWIVIGRYKEGDYPIWSLYYWRCWLVRSVYRLFAFSTLHGTPFMPQLCRWMGSTVGNNVYIASDVEGSDLIEIGSGTSINAEAQLRFMSVERGILKLRRIRIGKNCEIGQRAVVEGGATMEDNSILGPLSMLKEGDVLPANELWEGSPARRVGPGEETLKPPDAYWKQRLYASFWYSFAFVALAIFPLLACIPGGLILGWAENNYEWYYAMFAAPLVVALFMVLVALQIAAAKSLLMGSIQPGRYALHSGFYIKHWFCDQLMSLSLDVLFPAYATLFLPPWLRLLGARLGHHAEVSTMVHFTPDLVDIGDDVFVADAVSLGAPRVRNGWLELSPVKIGKSSFVGNSAVVPGGTELGEKCLIGCLSIAPKSLEDRARYDTSWMGSPAINLPNRPINTRFSEEFTYAPSRLLYFQRVAFELVRMILPGTVIVATSLMLMTWLSDLGDELEWSELIALFPCFSIALGLVAVTITILLKWLIIGRYHAGEQPLWSTFVWRTELVTALHDFLATPIMLSQLQGTPFLSWYFRAMGTKVGSNVYFDSTYMTEFDLVKIGSNACIDTECDLQTHLFEDRVMKMSRVHVGNDCTVGASSVVLYDTNMKDGVALAPLSLVLKGETLQAGMGRWIGAPVTAQIDSTSKKSSVPRLSLDVNAGGELAANE